jgi:hypothetical protein
MKKSIFITFITLVGLTGCATVQSVVRSVFPYTATLIIPATNSSSNTFSISSAARSFDQIFTGQTNNNQISQVRIASAKIDAMSPTTQNLGTFKSIKLYLVNGKEQTLVATRTDIAATAGRSIMLDTDNSKLLDDYLKTGTSSIKMEYVLQNNLSVDLSVKVSLSFNVATPTR